MHAEPPEIEVPSDIVGHVVDLTMLSLSEAQLSSKVNIAQTTPNPTNTLQTSSRPPAIPLAIIPATLDSIPEDSPPSNWLPHTTEFPEATAEGSMTETEVVVRVEPPHNTVAPPDPEVLEAPPRTPTPTVNVISPTPQTSQDAPAGTITTLVVSPNPHNRARSRSWSHTPIPAESPMLTWLKSRSGTLGPSAQLPNLPPILSSLHGNSDWN